MPAFLTAIWLISAPYQNPMPTPAVNRLVPVVERTRLDLNELRDFYDLAGADVTFDRLSKFYDERRSVLKKSASWKKSAEEEIDYRLLDSFLAYRSRQVEFERAKVKETDGLTPFAPHVLTLELNRRRMEPIDPEVAAKSLNKLDKEVRDQKAALAKLVETKKNLPLLVVADRTAKRVDGLRRTLDFWFKQFDGFHPLFSWWCKKPFDAASASLADYAKFLREKVVGYREGEDPPLIGDPIGREALLNDIQYEMLDRTPEQLLEIADKEFAWCEAEAKKASREMGLGENWKAAMDKVKALHVPPGEQDQLVVKQAREAIKFLEDRDLVTIEPLCKETWRTEMLGQETQKTLPFAVYMGQRMGISFPLATQDHETKEMSLRGNNEHFTRAITHHELIPGHHLQGYMAERYQSHRRLFSTPFLVEGWALYWEMLLWDLGFPRGPEDRLGMLFWRMHRCARIIVSLKFHLGQMKPAEMIDFLVDRVAHERFTATSEVRRFIGDDYSPLYQCAYMVGGLQLRELEAKYVKSKQMSYKQFHDSILHSGPIPIKQIDFRLGSIALRN